MATLQVQLKQHTPIIHFQHHQDGATLRASELKPKLDKFLIKKLELTEKNRKGEEVPKKSYERWFNNKEKLSLDYKVKIIDNDLNPTKGKVEVMPSITEKWILSNDLMLTLMTYNVSLKAEIKNHIDLFFAKNNFGKRQSKGFGCFYPSYLEEKIFKNKLKENNDIIYKCNQSLSNEIQLDTYFYSNIISKCWGRLKSGKNHGDYEKSRIFEYLSANNFRWDKRWIKKKLKELIANRTLPEDLIYSKAPIDFDSTNGWEDNSNEEYRFGRAMLGLAEHYEFRARNNYLYQVKILNSEIERFKSPVTFKVFKKNIYALVEKIDSEIFNSDFSFKVSQKQNKISVGSPITINGSLITPSLTEFKLPEFLEKYFKTVGFTKL